jgi:hypothetical protein
MLLPSQQPVLIAPRGWLPLISAANLAGLTDAHNSGPSAYSSHR